MKKIILLLLTLIIILSGCSGGVSSGEEDKGTDSAIDNEYEKLQVLPSKMFPDFPGVFINSETSDSPDQVSQIKSFLVGSEETYVIAAMAYLNADILFKNKDEIISVGERKVLIDDNYISILKSLLPDFIDGSKHINQLKDSITILYDINYYTDSDFDRVEFYSEVLGVDQDYSSIFDYRKYSVTNDNIKGEIKTNFKIDGSASKSYIYYPKTDKFTFISESDEGTNSKIESMNIASKNNEFSFYYYSRLRDGNESEISYSTGYFDTNGGAITVNYNNSDSFDENIAENNDTKYIFDNYGNISSDASVPVGPEDEKDSYDEELSTVEDTLDNIPLKNVSTIEFEKAVSGGEYYFLGSKIDESEILKKELILGYGFSTTNGIITFEVWDSLNYQPGQLIYIYIMRSDGTYEYLGEVYGPEYYY